VSAPLALLAFHHLQVASQAQLVYSVVWVLIQLLVQRAQIVLQVNLHLLEAYQALIALIVLQVPIQLVLAALVFH